MSRRTLPVWAAPYSAGLQEAQRTAQLLVQQCDQAGPQRGDGAGAADHHVLAVDAHLVAGGRVARCRRRPARRARAWRRIADAGTPALACQAGSGEDALTPPPPALLSDRRSRPSRTRSSLPLAARRCRRRPARSGWRPGSRRGPGRRTALPVLVAEPLSPEAKQTVMPIAAAAWNAWSNGCQGLRRPVASRARPS